MKQPIWKNILQIAQSEPPSQPIDTSVVRFIRTRFEMTHHERAICVIAGPWGIGKTTAINSFAVEYADSCAIVRVEQGTFRRGASPVFTLQLAVEALRPLIGRAPRATLSNAYWSLRQMLNDHLEEWRSQRQIPDLPSSMPTFTLVFDEAQYLSREAIEMLRYWNDDNGTVAPFPVGLIFVGNSEFALESGGGGESVLTGAVRSRALFLEKIEYDDVKTSDIEAFLLSRGSYDDAALSLVTTHFSQPRIRKDFRSLARLDEAFRRRSQGTPISCEIVRSIIG